MHAKSCTRGVVDRRQHQQGDGGLQVHDPGHQVHAADPGHVHVQQDAGDPLALEDGERLFAPGGGGDLIALLQQKPPERAPNGLLVVYDEERDRLGRRHTSTSLGGGLVRPVESCRRVGMIHPCNHRPITRQTPR
jgi:hypothetical protein